MVKGYAWPATTPAVAERIAQLTLEQKIGQMIVVGFLGTECTDEIEHFLGSCHVGGVMLTDKNIVSPDQTRVLIDRLQEIAADDVGMDLFVTVDQEGGNVSRLGYPVTVLPTAMAIAATGAIESAERCAQVCATEMRAMGFNVNFAPVLDVNTDHSNPVIGIRSYGDHPDLVAEYGSAVIETLRRNGVLATAKHFPGHGDTWVDSHLDLPVICRGREELHSIDLPPFRTAIDRGVDMIMTAHAIFPGLSDCGLPATLSRDIVQGLLREDMGYDGLVITDALVMDAIARSYSLGESAISAVEAGADIVLMLSTAESQIAAFEALVNAVKTGRLSERRIDDSARRIVEAKNRISLSKPATNTGTELASWPMRSHQETVRNVARRAVTLLRNRGGLLPLNRLEGKRLGIVEFASRRFSPVEDSRCSNGSLCSSIAGRHGAASSVIMDAIPVDGMAEGGRVIEESDVVVIITRNAHLIESQASLARRLIALGKPTVVVALRNPYDLLAFPEADCYVATYGDSPCQVEAARDLLFGEFAPSGRLPVAIPGLYKRGHGQQDF